MTNIPTIARAAADIADGRLSPVVLAEECFARIDRHERRVNAFVQLERERALAAALKAETEIKAGRRRGPLHGIPFAHKDIYETAGIPTTCHSKLLKDYVPTHDAFTVARLSDAGGAAASPPRHAVSMVRAGSLKPRQTDLCTPPG